MRILLTVTPSCKIQQASDTTNYCFVFYEQGGRQPDWLTCKKKCLLGGHGKARRTVMQDYEKLYQIQSFSENSELKGRSGFT